MKSFYTGPEIVLSILYESANERVNQKVSADMLRELSVLHNSNLRAFFHCSQHQNY